ncbi:MAG: alpha/beta hydrolase family protein [Thermoplasmatota archaeon]
MRSHVVSIALAALALAALPAHPAAAGTVGPQPFTLSVNGENATGLVEYPATATPTILVVLCHGHHYTASSLAGRYDGLAAKGAVVVGMDYRGPLGFNVENGSEDTVAATQYMLGMFPSVTTVYLFGVSMGGEVSGMAIHAAPDLYNYWVDDEGLTNLAETWAEATAVGDVSAAEIANETGGTPASAPQAYEARSPALLASNFELARTVIVHAVWDGRVPYDQGREMAAALVSGGHATDVYTVLTAKPGDEGTTISGDFGLPNPANLAGHSDEATHQEVVEVGFQKLNDLIDHHGVPGLTPFYREYVVDATAGQVGPP